MWRRGRGDLNLKQVIPLGLGVARILLPESVTMIQFSAVVLSNMSVGRKEGEIGYQRENVDKTPQVAVTVFHRGGQAGILLWSFLYWNHKPSGGRRWILSKCSVNNLLPWKCLECWFSRCGRFCPRETYGLFTITRGATGI